MPHESRGDIYPSARASAAASRWVSCPLLRTVLAAAYNSMNLVRGQVKPCRDGRHGVTSGEATHDPLNDFGCGDCLQQRFSSPNSDKGVVRQRTVRLRIGLLYNSPTYHTVFRRSMVDKCPDLPHLPAVQVKSSHPHVPFRRGKRTRTRGWAIIPLLDLPPRRV